MKKLFLISSFFSCATLMLEAQINKMRNTTNTTQNVQPVRTVNQNSVVKQMVTSYNGMLNISPDVNSKMQAEWQASSNQFAGVHLKAELWSVVYGTDPNKSNYTQILLQQRIGPLNISYQAVNGGISYSLNNSQTILPSGNNLAVIVFCDQLKSAPLIIHGKPNDGAMQNGVQAAFHRYESNAKTKLGQNIVYGIYSIVPGKTDLSHLDFTFSVPGQVQNADFITDAIDDIGEVASKVINGVTYVFDQTVHGVTGFAKIVFNNALSIDGFFINQAGQIFYDVAGSLINIIAYGNLPKERDLRQEEYDFLISKIFQGANMPTRSKIKVFNFMSVNHRFYTIPGANGNIYMNVGDAYDNLIGFANSSYPAPGQVFVHEFTHAWQVENNSFDKVLMQGLNNQVVGGGSNSVYQPNCSSVNNDFNFEQQATIVDLAYSSLYYPGAMVAFKPCDFDVKWVIQNIRRNTPLDTNAIKAAIVMKKHAAEPSIKLFVGNVTQDIAVYSKGNSKDGNGYYLPGNAGSFLYYSNNDNNSDSPKKAFANWGPVRKKYESLGAELGILSWPVDDNKGTPKRPGVYQYFKGGAIYYSAATGAFYLSGPLLTKWQSLGYENSRLGFPKSDPVTQTNGNAKLSANVVTTTIQLFEGGQLFMQETRSASIGNSESISVHVIYNNLLTVWDAKFGFPVSDQSSVPQKTAGGISHLLVPAFDSVATQNADIYLSSQFGGHVVTGEIRNAYRSYGGSSSALGLPIGDRVSPPHSSDINKVLNNSAEYYQEFQGGTIHYANGKINVQYKSTPIQNANNLKVIH